jgi:glycosyltransferase involved in cell wall biosynthesis
MNPGKLAAPFLSVITRTQGRRSSMLRDTLMSLAGQACQDFEIILVVHSRDEEAAVATRTLINEFPETMRQRIRVITCERPGRSSPLNDALRHADGQYFAMLDDDDLVLAQWVEAFRQLASAYPGSVVRAKCACQEVELSDAGDLGVHARATSWFSTPWPSDYDPIAHLAANFTPNMSVAFPMAVFRDHHLVFDETLETAEDWDLLLRAAMLCGVKSSPQITAIYRWWTDGESTQFSYSKKEWEFNASRVWAKLDAQAIMLPAGSVSRIVCLQQRCSELEARIRAIEDSRSWRVSAPLRAFGRLIRWLGSRGARRTPELVKKQSTP